MKKYKFKFDKLVRDNVSNIIKNLQIDVVEKTLSTESFINCLKDKLVEESLEVKNAGSGKQLIEELADVLEVFDFLLKSLNISLDTVESYRKQKAKTNGTFELRNYIDYIELYELNPEFKKYISQNDKYPLIEP